MKNFIVGIALFFCGFFNAQLGGSKIGWAIAGMIVLGRVEATKMNDKSFFSYGSKLPINDNNYVGLKGHFNWWDTPGRKLIVIPELDYFHKITISKEEDVNLNLYIGAGVSPNAFSPKLGFIIYHCISAEAGYNFEYKPYKHFPTEGFRFSFGFNLVL